MFYVSQFLVIISDYLTYLAIIYSGSDDLLNEIRTSGVLLRVCTERHDVASVRLMVRLTCPMDENPRYTFRISSLHTNAPEDHY